MASPYSQAQANHLEALRDYIAEDKEADLQAQAIRTERREKFKILISDSQHLHNQVGSVSVAAFAAGEKAGVVAGTAAAKGKSDQKMAKAHEAEVASLQGKIGRLQEKLGGARATVRSLRAAASAASAVVPAVDAGKVAGLEADIHDLRVTVDNLETKVENAAPALAYYSTEMPVLLSKMRTADIALKYYSAAEIRCVRSQVRRMRASRTRSMNNRRLNRHDATLEKSVVEFGQEVATMVENGTFQRVSLVAAAQVSYARLRQNASQMKTVQEGSSVLFAWRTRVRDVWGMTNGEMATIMA